MKIQTEILGQQITVQVSRLGDFQCVETMEKVILPDDLESGKAIEEVYTSQTEILGQQITVQVSRLGDFQCVETMEKVILPDDLESGKAIEEVFASLQEVLIREVWTGEDWKFFPEPNIEIGFFLSAIDKKLLPPEVARFPENFWYDHTDDVWRKIN